MVITFLDGKKLLIHENKIIAASKTIDTIEVWLEGQEECRIVKLHHLSPEDFTRIWNRLMYLEQKSRQ